MTRQEVLANYSVDSNNIITELGKFQGEMIYAPHFYDIYSNGGADDDGEIISFKISDEDRKEFPELGAAKQIDMIFDDFGFVYLCETK